MIKFEEKGLFRQGKKALLATTVALSYAAPVWAQDGQSAQRNRQSAQAQPSVTDTIIVTATRRAERLFDVPASIQAVNGEELELLGAVDFSDYARTLAGVSFIDAGAGRSQIFIRGVSTGGDIGQGKEATVGVYLGETPISESSSQPDIKLFDIERVEVLRGPQGTLYGSGSMGGTLRVIPRAPDYGKWSGRIQATGSSTHEGGLNGALNGWVNVPIAENVALRVVGYTIHNDGFLDDDYAGAGSSSGEDINDEETYGGRLSLRVEPTDRLDILLTGIYQNGEFGAFEQVTDEFDDLVIHQSADQPFEDEYKIANLDVTYEFDFASLTSSTSFFDRRRYLENDIDYFLEAVAGIPRGYSPLLYEASTFSQEVRLASSGSGPWSWIVGAFYLDRSEDFSQTINVSGAPVPDDPAANLFYLDRFSDVTQLAGFAEVGLDLTDRLTATVGVRVTNVERSNRAVQDGLFFGARTDLSGDFDEQSTTPKFNLSYQAQDNFLFYFQAAQGFRIGGVNPGLPPCDPAAGCVVDVGDTYGSDSLWSYEAGTKLQLLDDSWMIAASVFYIDWTDIQLSVSRGDGFDGFLNSGNATSQGFEIETTARLNDFVRVGGQITYTDAQLEDISAGLAGVATAGQMLPDVPEWSSALNVEVGGTVLGGRYGYVRGDLQFVGDRQSALGPASTELPAYTLLNLRAGVDAGPYRLAVFAQNVTDERAELSRTSLAGVRLGQPLALDRVTINRPRTIGVSLSREF
jgi:iron complex outermembrane recepter protein